MFGLVRAIGAGLAALTLAACSTGDAISEDAEAYDGIPVDDVVNLLGNEPFWSIEIDGETAVYSTPENINGTQITVARFSGNNGLGYSGELNGEPLQIAVTPGQCSDTMSDRSYPFTATVALGEETLLGCGYTSSMPFVEGETR